MSRARLLFYCQHSLGLGHLARSLAIAEALTGTCDVTLLNGGRLPAGTRLPPGVRVVNLPPLGHDDDYQLVSLHPDWSVAAAQQERRRTILDVLDRESPQVLLVELYPFGRKKFEFELLPLLEAARAGGPRRPLVLCSLRDILVRGRRDQAGHDERAAERANAFFDAVLVHSDPAFARLEETFTPRSPLRIPVHYTGFVAPPPLPHDDGHRLPRLLVSAGGGMVGEPLFRAAVEAHAELAERTGLSTTLVAGPFLPEPVWQWLQHEAADSPQLHAVRRVDDLAAEMRRSTLSLSQAGYNTTMDILRAGTPSVVVPFSDGREDEQTSRARRLEDVGALRMVPTGELGTGRLLTELVELAGSRPSPVRLDLTGRTTTARIVAELAGLEPGAASDVSPRPRQAMGLAPAADRSDAVGVIGLGYVGLVTAATLASLGHDVVCVDIDPEKIRRLRAGDVPVVEPGLSELLLQHRDRLTWSLDAADVFGRARIVFVTVDTPGLASGDADLSRVESVIDRIPDDVPPMILAMKSTVPVGTGARVRRHLRGRGLDQVTYVSNPEFLREGTALGDVMHPDRVVIGADDRSDAEEVARLWAPLGGQLRCCDLASAEMIKLASNAFLATKISFVNEIANVCENVGADVTVVAEGMGLDRRIGAEFLEAGLGYGGSCFPKDVAALKQLAGNSGYHFQLLSAVIEVNELQKRRVVAALAARLGTLAGARVALLGVSFKPWTDDVRESPALVLAERLTAEGAVVVAHDPVVGTAAATVLPDGVGLARDLAEAVDGADAAVIVTAWPQYGGLLEPGVSATMARPLLVDGRNMLDPYAAARAGYEWVGIGRPGHSHDSAAGLGHPMVRAR